MEWEEITIGGKLFQFRLSGVAGGFSVQWRRWSEFKDRFPVQKLSDHQGKVRVFSTLEKAREAVIEHVTRFAQVQD